MIQVWNSSIQFTTRTTTKDHRNLIINNEQQQTTAYNCNNAVFFKNRGIVPATNELWLKKTRDNFGNVASFASIDDNEPSS
jgi:hypothetical protein